jgi:GTP-binding protein HflX
MVEQVKDGKGRKTAVLFSVQTLGISDEENHSSLTELERLVTTMGLEVVAKLTQKRASPVSSTLLGAGRLMELAGFTGGTGIVEGFSKKSGSDKSDLEDSGDDGDDASFVAMDEDPGKIRASVVVYDGEITPNQLQNLEQATGVEVLDRTGVILEIFSKHAKSREARLQVEIAKLAYLAPRLRASHVGGDRQGGGIGSKGAGETSYELDKRRIRDRIAELRGQLVGIRNEQETRRSRRKENFQVSLVGYTNAGKSSLMRALTGTDVLVADRLFATLDTRVRPLHPKGFPPVLVSDTVGFIKKLPHDLVASFRSTLDEALAASVLLFTVDASDPAFRSQLEVTKTVLAEIGADEIESRLILNKVDRLSTEEIAVLRSEFPDGIFISAHRPDDIASLRRYILDFFEIGMVESTMNVPYDKGQLLGQLRERARVIKESYEETGTDVTFKAFPETVAWLQKNLIKTP